LATGLVYGFYLAIMSEGKPVQISPYDDPVILTLSVVSTSVSMVLGLLGLSLLRKFRRATSATASPPAAVPALPVPGHE
jgi:hypothetical protein